MVSFSVLRKIQKISLEAFSLFKEIADENNLRYFGIGGTCIGTVRHNGFIPWDDDIDIAMPYQDLIKFCNIFNNYKIKEFELYTPYDHPHFAGFFIKLNKANTAYIEKNIAKYPDSYKGIGIDIMPIFGLPRGYKEQLDVTKRNTKYLLLNKYSKIPYPIDNSIIHKLMWVMLHPVSQLFRKEYWINKIIKEYSDVPFNNSDKILFAWRRMYTPKMKGTYKSIFNYKDFEKFIEKKFEHTTMRIPVGWENYLKMDFGDYMTLPPLEKQQPPHNIVLIDTEKSYRNYIGRI